VQRDQFMQLFERAVAADTSTLDRDLVSDAIAAVTRLSAWCDSQQIAYAQALANMGAPAEDVMAK